MSGMELNKIIAAILLASIIAMLVGTVANILYKPDLNPAQRGYNIAVTENEQHENGEPVANAVIDIAELMKTANAEAGRSVIKKCVSCHALEKDGQNRLGPALWNIAGSAKAKVSGYKYSEAIIAKGGVWDDESLFYFLQKPSSFIAGTKMSFMGLNKVEDIVNVIAFLKAFVSDSK